jgi:hypothetical protein
MKILFGAGHVEGAKIWMGYNEDENMLDLARREARYAADRYGQETAVFSVTKTSYQAVEDACRGCDIAIFEHSNAEASPVKGTANRVTIYRTVKNRGDGVCLKLAQATATILDTKAYPVQHRANSAGDDWYGVLKRAMQAGCQDAWLMENGFHTHGPTRALLSDPMFRQRLAEVKVDAMAKEYGWEESDMIRAGDKGEAVKAWQNALMLAGYSLAPYNDDGSFGPLSQRQTDAFKADAGLAIDTPVTVAEAEWLAWGHMMIAKTAADSAGRIADADARTQAAEAARLVAESKIAAIRKAIGTLKEI